MKQRLLIVDDEPGIVDMMASYFSSLPIKSSAFRQVPTIISLSLLIWTN